MYIYKFFLIHISFKEIDFIVLHFYDCNILINNKCGCVIMKCNIVNL